MNPIKNTIIVRRGRFIIPPSGIIMRDDQIRNIECDGTSQESSIVINRKIFWNFNKETTRDEELLRLLNLLDNNVPKGIF